MIRHMFIKASGMERLAETSTVEGRGMLKDKAIVQSKARMKNKASWEGTLIESYAK